MEETTTAVQPLEGEPSDESNVTFWTRYKPVFFFVGVFVSGIIGSHYLFSYANTQVNNFKVKEIIEIDSADCSEQDIMGSIANEYPLLYQRLNQQLEYTKKRKKYHLNVMSFFSSQYFSVVSVASVAAVFTAVFLFLILRRGWDSCSNQFKAVFLGLFANTAFFSVQPALYSHEKNIASHQIALTGYRGIHDNILTVVATKGWSAVAPEAPANPMEEALKRLILKNDQLFTVYKINISIDASHIPNYQNLANGLEIGG